MIFMFCHPEEIIYPNIFDKMLFILFFLKIVNLWDSQDNNSVQKHCSMQLGFLKILMSDQKQ